MILPSIICTYMPGGVPAFEHTLPVFLGGAIHNKIANVSPTAVPGVYCLALLAPGRLSLCSVTQGGPLSLLQLDMGSGFPGYASPCILPASRRWLRRARSPTSQQGGGCKKGANVLSLCGGKTRLLPPLPGDIGDDRELAQGCPANKRQRPSDACWH